MDNPTLALVVSLLAVGSVIILGVLGHLIEKNAESVEQKREGK
jgi:hypothetical protein